MAPPGHTPPPTMIPSACEWSPNPYPSTLDGAREWRERHAQSSRRRVCRAWMTRESTTRPVLHSPREPRGPRREMCAELCHTFVIITSPVCHAWHTDVECRRGSGHSVPLPPDVSCAPTRCGSFRRVLEGATQGPVVRLRAGRRHRDAPGACCALTTRWLRKVDQGASPARHR